MSTIRETRRLVLQSVFFFGNRVSRIGSNRIELRDKVADTSSRTRRRLARFNPRDEKNPRGRCCSISLTAATLINTGEEKTDESRLPLEPDWRSGLLRREKRRGTRAERRVYARTPLGEAARCHAHARHLHARVNRT